MNPSEHAYVVRWTDDHGNEHGFPCATLAHAVQEIAFKMEFAPIGRVITITKVVRRHPQERLRRK